jgi:hypothetical protein
MSKMPKFTNEMHNKKSYDFGTIAENNEMMQEKSPDELYSELFNAIDYEQGQTGFIDLEDLYIVTSCAEWSKERVDRMLAEIDDKHGSQFNF